MRPMLLLLAVMQVGCASMQSAHPAQAEQPAHPLDGLSATEYDDIQHILREHGIGGKETLFPLIELKEPAKAEVVGWKAGEPPDRKALVQYTSPDGFREAVVNLTRRHVEEDELIDGGGQPMVLLAEFTSAAQVAHTDDRMVVALAKRGLAPDQVFCLPLTAGNFFTPAYDKRRLMKIPCYVNPTGSNFYAHPIEGLFAVYDLSSRVVIDVVDTGVVPLSRDSWGYTEAEVAERSGLRPLTNPVTLGQPGGPNYTIKGGHIAWDLWRFNFRVDKRPGLVISNLEVKDQDRFRSVIYQMHLSEVFVPYMDPDENFYWRTYMDSGEYGFGLFLTPLTKGVDCPAFATFLPAVTSDDTGAPLEIPNAICVFERNVGDPAWRHFEVFAQTPETPVPAEGRPATELVVRTASEIGNYDYFIDYRFKQDGQILVMIGSTGLDAVKGVTTTSMKDATAEEDTRYGTLIAPNLVAPNHDHYFNFRIDFDVDQPRNVFGTMEIVPAKVPADSPRRSLWDWKMEIPKSEMDARYTMSATAPKHFHISNPSREGYLGHRPGWMIHHGSVAYGPFDFKSDPPFVRNPWVQYSVWNTVQNDAERYAGGRYAMHSDGSETLLTYAADDQALSGQDVVTWFTAGFHHIPRMEDWPVMSTEWKMIHIQPFNFFSHNPALTLRKNPQPSPP